MWLLTLGLLAGCLPGAAVGATSPGVVGALTVSGDVTGYATFTIDRPTVLHYNDTQIVRTGDYAGAVVDSIDVMMSSSAWPEARQRAFWRGWEDRQLARAGTYRIYLVTQNGAHAKVTIPWDGPPVSVTVTTPVSHEFHIERRKLLTTSNPVVTLRNETGGPDDQIWAMALYEAHQAEAVPVRVGLCITRRGCGADALAGTSIKGWMAGGGMGAGSGFDGDGRHVKVVGTTTTGTQPPAMMLNTLTVWSLRLPMDGHILPFGRPVESTFRRVW